MSGRELQRIEVLSEVLARRRSEISAAAILGLSTRQTRRLLAAYRNGGGGALIHKARGRTSNNRLIPGIREGHQVLRAASDNVPRFEVRVLFAAGWLESFDLALRIRIPYWVIVRSRRGCGKVGKRTLLSCFSIACFALAAESACDGLGCSMPLLFKLDGADVAQS